MYHIIDIAFGSSMLAALWAELLINLYRSSNKRKDRLFHVYLYANKVTLRLYLLKKVKKYKVTSPAASDAE